MFHPLVSQAPCEICPHYHQCVALAKHFEHASKQIAAPIFLKWQGVIDLSQYNTQLQKMEYLSLPVDRYRLIDVQIVFFPLTLRICYLVAINLNTYPEDCIQPTI